MDQEELQLPFRVVECVYYATIWIVACLAGISRALRSDSHVLCRDFVGVGLCSGFLGLAVVSLRNYATGGFTGTEWGGVGIAAIIGLAGKEQETIIRLIWRAMLTKMFGNEIHANEKDPQETKNIASVDSRIDRDCSLLARDRIDLGPSSTSKSKKMDGTGQ